MAYTLYMAHTHTQKNRTEDMTSMRIRKKTLTELRTYALPAHIKKVESDDVILQRVLGMHKKKKGKSTPQEKEVEDKL